MPKGTGLVFGYDHPEVLTWRHLHVFRVRPPWEGLSTHFTKEFEAFALLLLRELPMRKVAELVGETDPRRWRMLVRQVDAAPVPRRISATCAVSAWTS